MEAGIGGIMLQLPLASKVLHVEKASLSWQEVSIGMQSQAGAQTSGKTPKFLVGAYTNHP